MKLILFLIMLIFLAILVGANIYLSQRFAYFLNLNKTWPLYLIFFAITIYMISGIIIFSNATSNTGSLLYCIAAILMGFMLYLLLVLLLIDGVNLIINIPVKVHLAIVVGLSVLISLYGIWNASNLKVTSMEIPINGITKEIHIMHLSDIHIGHFRGKMHLKKIINKTNSHNPDLVFITGDLFDGKINLSLEILDPLSELKAAVFFVDGNHDGYTGVKTIKHYLREKGVRVLENEIITFDELQIIGLNHMSADDQNTNIHANEGHTIKEVLKTLTIDINKASVLLHHSPVGIKYANDNGIDLYLSGHTHAGQLFPINFLNDLFFKYNKGLHKFKNTQVFVSQGAGTFGPPMRIGTISEISLIKLIPQSE
ncbi:metallophosphoesterase [Bacteroidota bacterium]